MKRFITYPQEPNLIVDAAHFDGANDFMRIAALSGVVDGKKGIFSAWVRFTGSDGVQKHLLCQDSAILSGVQHLATSAVTREASNILRVKMDRDNGVAGAPILQLSTSGTYTIASGWVHILASWDLATAGARHLYINDVLDMNVDTFTNDIIDYANLFEWLVGANLLQGDPPPAARLLDADLADLYFNTVDYLDFSLVSNRRKFISAGLKPVYLGTDGSVPTGSVPVVYQHLADAEAAANFATNRGTGGNFAITGALTTGASSPSD